MSPRYIGVLLPAYVGMGTGSDLFFIFTPCISMPDRVVAGEFDQSSNEENVQVLKIAKVHRLLDG